MDQVTLAFIKKLVFTYLDRQKYRVFIFGSRASGSSRKFSDIDIGIEAKGEIPAATLVEIEEAFNESDLPYTIDLVDFSNVSHNFKSQAKKQTIYLN